MGTDQASEVGRRAGLLWWGAVLLIVVGLVATWRWSPLAEYADPEVLAARAAPLRDSALAPVFIIAVYVIASLLVAPIMGLVVATGMLFGPLRGAAYSTAGIMLSAAANYAIGRWL